MDRTDHVPAEMLLSGGYDQIEDAAEARTEAEKNIFGNFRKWYEEKYQKKKTGEQE